MLRILALAFLLFHHIQDTRADCCHPVIIRFQLTNKTVRCDTFGGTPVLSDYGSSSAYEQIKAFASEVHYRSYPTCDTRPLCGDGEKVGEGFFCGRGRCNAFGCACEGGCITGDPAESFRLMHGEQNFESVRPWGIF